MSRSISAAIIFCMAMFFCTGCYRNTTEQNFQKPVFINDNSKPGLPIISDFGYNAFGAYYNSKVWASPKAENYNLGNVIFLLGATKDSTGIFFRGTYDVNQNVEIGLLITKNTISTDDDLRRFSNRSFNLNGDSVKLKIAGKVVSVQSGNINFASVRRLVVDNKKIGTILSGTFEMSGTASGENVQLKNGRFDILVQSITSNLYLGKW